MGLSISSISGTIWTFLCFAMASTIVPLVTWPSKISPLRNFRFTTCMTNWITAKLCHMFDTVSLCSLLCLFLCAAHQQSITVCNIDFAFDETTYILCSSCQAQGAFTLSSLRDTVCEFSAHLAKHKMHSKCQRAILAWPHVLTLCMILLCKNQQLRHRKIKRSGSWNKNCTRLINKIEGSHHSLT